MLGMADLGEEDRRAHLRKRVAKTEDQATSHVNLPVGGEGRNNGAHTHDEAADGDWDFTSNPLRQEWTAN